MLGQMPGSGMLGSAAKQVPIKRTASAVISGKELAIRATAVDIAGGGLVEGGSGEEFHRELLETLTANVQTSRSTTTAQQPTSTANSDGKTTSTLSFQRRRRTRSTTTRIHEQSDEGGMHVDKPGPADFGTNGNGSEVGNGLTGDSVALQTVLSSLSAILETTRETHATVRSHTKSLDRLSTEVATLRRDVSELQSQAVVTVL